MTRLKITLAALMISTATAMAAELVQFPNLSSPAEVKALQVLNKAVTVKCITSIDVTISHDTGAAVRLLNLVAGEQPPSIFSEGNSGARRDLTQIGLGRELTTSGALALFPTVVKDPITIDGEVRKVPSASISTAWSIPTWSWRPNWASIPPVGTAWTRSLPISTRSRPQASRPWPSVPRNGRSAIFSAP